MASLKRRRLYLLGHGIDYSLSPVLHAQALRERPERLSYELLDVPPQDFTDRTREVLASDDTLGLNVTKPYKRSVIPLLDSLSERASRIGAVNTIHRYKSGWRGANTDAPAFRETLVERFPFPDFASAVVLGSGGAARAVVDALLNAPRLRPEELTVVSRNQRTSNRLRHRFDPLQTRVELQTWSDRGDLPDSALVVNATPLGTGGSPSPLTVPALHGAGAVYDLVYSPSPTPLVNAARIAGVAAVDGRTMLRRQAELSRALWFGSAG